MFELENWSILKQPQYHWLMLVIALAVLGLVLDIRRKVTSIERRRTYVLPEKDVYQYNLFAHDSTVHPDP